MKFIFLIFLGFGLFSATMMKDGLKGGFAWDATAISIMGGAHAFFILLGYGVVRYSKKLRQVYGEDGTLSAGGWVFGLCASFLAGFIGYLIANRK